MCFLSMLSSESVKSVILFKLEDLVRMFTEMSGNLKGDDSRRHIASGLDEVDSLPWYTDCICQFLLGYILYSRLYQGLWSFLVIICKDLLLALYEITRRGTSPNGSILKHWGLWSGSRLMKYCWIKLQSIWSRKVFSHRINCNLCQINLTKTPS